MLKDDDGLHVMLNLDNLAGFYAAELRPIKTDRELLIDIILGAGNMSEGVLADAILQAGFRAPD